MTWKIKRWIIIHGKYLPFSACAQFQQIAAHSDVGVWEIAGRK